MSTPVFAMLAHVLSALKTTPDDPLQMTFPSCASLTYGKAVKNGAVWHFSESAHFGSELSSKARTNREPCFVHSLRRSRQHSSRPQSRASAEDEFSADAGHLDESSIEADAAKKLACSQLVC